MYKIKINTLYGTSIEKQIKELEEIKALLLKYVPYESVQVYKLKDRPNK